MNPKVSIVIPVYNNSSLIDETVQSVVSQDYSNFEITIVNDGSTDNSDETIKTIIGKYSNIVIKYISQSNQGPSSARNNGAKLCNGKYLLFLDGDDKIDPTYIRKCVQYLEENSAVSIVYSESAFFEAQNGPWILPLYSQEQLLKENCIHISAVIRSEAFNNAGGFDEKLRYNEDWELWIKITSLSNSGVYKIPETLFYYRKRTDGTSLTDQTDRNYSSEKSRIYIYNKHYHLYRKAGLGFNKLMSATHEAYKYKKKYYNIWYKRLYYKFKR